jgi:hypothetical protein
MNKIILVTSALSICGAGFLNLSQVACAKDNPRLISAVLEGPTLGDRIQKTTTTFTRDSLAYTSNGRMVPPGKPRFEKLAIFNRPEYTITQPCAATNVVVLAYHDGYFWGAKPLYGNGIYLYKSIDAIQWEPVAALEKGTITSLYVTEQGLLLVGTRFPGGVCIWDAGTGRLVRTLTMLSEDPFPKHWSWAEMNGVIYVGEYGYKYGSNNARRIYQSRDGGWNWEVLYDPPPADGYHVHKVLADPYRSHLYWSHGDNYSELFRSVDGGESWQFLSRIEQPTAGISRPEGAYLGADSGEIGIYRFLGGSAEAEYVCNSLVDGYIWDMQEFNGVIYATSNYHQYTTPNDVHATVLVSKDGEQWGNLYQWEPGTCGLERFACAENGVIYAVMEDKLNEVGTMIFPEPFVRTAWGATIGPAEDNLLADPSTSSFEGSEQCLWKAHGKVEMSIVSDNPHSGSNCLKVVNRGDSVCTMEVGSPTVVGNFPAGTVVGATFRLRGWNNVKWPYVQINDRTNHISSPNYYKRTGSNWSEFRIYWRLPMNSNALSVEVGGLSATPGNVFYVDSVCITANCIPVSFQMGGEPRAAEVLRHNIDFPEHWTDIFCWQRPFGSKWPIDTPKVFKSWSAQGNNGAWLELSLDQQLCVNLQEVQEGSVEPLVSLSAPDFPPTTLIYFAVVQDSNEINLYVLASEGWSYGKGRRAKIQPNTIFFGSTPQGTMQAGGIYSNARIYDEAMSREQVISTIDEIAQGNWRPGDIDGDGKVGFLDLAKLVGGGWATNCNEGSVCTNDDLNMDGVTNMEDFAILADSWDRHE